MNTLNRGVLTIHSCPMALIRHVEWSIESVLGTLMGRVQIDWRTQPLVAGTQRTQVEWRSAKDLSSEMASALKSWHYLRFEANSESETYRFTPDLGLHRAAIDSLGSILITENQVRNALENFDSEGTRELLNRALGHDWELELEPYRGVDLQEISHLRAI